MKIPTLATLAALLSSVPAHQAQWAVRQTYVNEAASTSNAGGSVAGFPGS